MPNIDNSRRNTQKVEKQIKQLQQCSMKQIKQLQQYSMKQIKQIQL